MKIIVPAAIGGSVLFSILVASFGGQARSQWALWPLLAISLLGLLNPRTRGRTASHVFALCVSIGCLIVVLVLVAMFLWSGRYFGWFFEPMFAAWGAFAWMYCGLAVNRKWPESVPLLLLIGALVSWVFFLEGARSFGFPLTGLMPFLCSLFGGWIGCLASSWWQGHGNKMGGMIAVSLAGISTFCALAITPPGSPRTIRIGSDHSETAYIVYGDGSNGVSVQYVLRLGSPSDEPVDVLYNTWMSDDYAKLTLVEDPQIINDAYAALAAQDDKRCQNAIADGSIPAFMGWLWKLRKVPRRGSIWVASPAY